ncbi:hypothetical protein HRQ91_02265 [Treponema parvum]|uniref:Uncharacterized protein n=1 Tax=Treponema parvum TaxID=138851 RepID=A0A975F2D4_9SPIR|nr:hypothetical protein [Treponema parvum]QTQ13370.1 hypothetical protein HRQ91_02265 [Treponema parvum]
MKYAADVKVNIKPIFSNMVHSDVWEGPCRVGLPEELEPSYEIRTGKEQFKVWKKELEDNLCSYASILPPVYIEFDESFAVSDSEFAKLEQDAADVDLFLITYRVPGLERFGKPISMINLGPTPVDIVAFYRDIGLDAYMAHDYEEFNELIKMLHVKKAIANTKMLVLSATEQVPASVNSSIPDMFGLFQRYGLRNNRVAFRNVFDIMEKLEVTDEMEKLADKLISGSKKTGLKREWILQDIKYYYSVRAFMEKYGCNAFTTACKELCASRYPMRNKCTPCLTHSLLKDDRIPSACEEDINALLAEMIFMYLTEKSVFMGNPVLVKKGSKTVAQLGMPKLLFDPTQVFDEDVLEIHHAVPGIMMEGYDQSPMNYELGHFTYEGWGSKIQVDMSKAKTKTVTFGRFNRRGTGMLVATGEILGCEFKETYCSPVVYYRVKGGAREFRQALANGCYGHHLAVVYGDYTSEIRKLGSIVGFKVEVFG